MARRTRTLVGLILTSVILSSVACGLEKKGTGGKSTAGYGTLDGFVYSSDTQEALEDVEVTCDDKSSITNERGYYKILDIRQGTRTVKASKPNYKLYSDIVELTDHTTHIIYLSPDIPKAPNDRAPTQDVR